MTTKYYTQDFFDSLRNKPSGDLIYELIRIHSMQEWDYRHEDQQMMKKCSIEIVRLLNIRLAI